jgi:Protein of unknown function (DUF732)
VNGQTTRTVIATGTCMTLGIALSAAVGLVPHVSANEGGGVHGMGADVPFQVLLDAAAQHPAHAAASVSRPATHTAHLRRASSTSSVKVAPAVQSGTSQSGTAHNASSAVTSTQPATTAKKKTHHKKATHKKTGHKPATTTPTLAARTTPSDAAVSSAITGLKQYIHTPFSINSSEVGSFGNDVCSAFDANNTLSQVEAQILAELQKLPDTTVESGAADFVVDTAVKLYCPGYNSRLG